MHVLYSLLDIPVSPHPCVESTEYQIDLIMHNHSIILTNTILYRLHDITDADTDYPLPVFTENAYINQHSNQLIDYVAPIQLSNYNINIHIPQLIDQLQLDNYDVKYDHVGNAVNDEYNIYHNIHRVNDIPSLPGHTESDSLQLLSYDIYELDNEPTVTIINSTIELNDIGSLHRLGIYDDVVPIRIKSMNLMNIRIGSRHILQQAELELLNGTIYNNELHISMCSSI